MKNPFETNIPDNPDKPDKPDKGSKDDDFVNILLKYKGIDDPEKIKFEDDNGVITDRAWKDLTTEEKANILKSQDTDPERDLDDDEINLISTLRDNKVTPQQFVDAIGKKAISDYVAQNGEPAK